MSDVIKVLAIDDEDTVQSILTAFINRYLEEKGVESSVKMLSDPVQGLFELTTQGDQYNAILLDVRLPKLTGDEIYSSLIHVNPELLGRVVFVTGYPDDLTDRFPDMDLEILQKPFRYQDFTEKLNTVLKPN
jgi:two-component system LytT family response regulator